MLNLRDLLLSTAFCFSAIAHSQQLRGEELRAVVSGHTIAGKDWAEFYSPGGQIVGRARYFGMVRNYVGRWTAHEDRICYYYENSTFDTCSRLELRGDLVHHFSMDGRLKSDGVGRRVPGNALQ
jgi:hypothetical protein